MTNRRFSSYNWLTVLWEAFFCLLSKTLEVKRKLDSFNYGVTLVISLTLKFFFTLLVKTEHLLELQIWSAEMWPLWVVLVNWWSMWKPATIATVVKMSKKHCFYLHPISRGDMFIWLLNYVSIRGCSQMTCRNWGGWVVSKGVTVHTLVW